MAINKVILGTETLIDLTGDTVSESTLLFGATAHNNSGEVIEGTCDFDSNTNSATVQVAEMLLGKTAYARGAKITGTMPNIGNQTNTITTLSQEVPIKQGYHDGSGSVEIDSVEKSKIIPSNIKTGVRILNVVGTLEPSSSVTAQSKTITPKLTKQTITPDENYDYLSQVVVNAISRVDIENAAGGTTVTIAG